MLPALALLRLPSVTLTFLLFVWCTAGFLVLWTNNESRFITFCSGAIVTELLVVWVLKALTLRVISWIVLGRNRNLTHCQGFISIMVMPQTVEILLFNVVVYSLPVLALFQVFWIVTTAVAVNKSLVTYSDDRAQLVIVCLYLALLT